MGSVATKRQTAAAAPQSRTRKPKTEGREKYLRPTRSFSHATKAPEDNYSPVPHMFWALLGQERVSGGAQIVVLGYIMARTWGDKEKPCWVQISLSDFVRELKISEKMVELALADAFERRLIGIRKCGQSRLFQLTPENWATAKKYEPKGSAAIDAEEPDDKHEEDGAAGDGAPKFSGDTLLVLPGRKSKPMPLRVALKGIDAPAELKCSYNIDEGFPFPLSISATSVGNGLLNFYIRQKEGEEKASNLRNPLRRFDNTCVDNTALTNYRAYFSPIFVRELKKPLEESFLRQIATAASFAPVADFSPALEKLRKRKLLNSGMILKIAGEEIGPAWLEHQAAERETAESQRSEQLDRQLRAPIAAAISQRAGDTLADYKRITGNRAAEVEDWMAAIDVIEREFAMMPPAGPTSRAVAAGD